MTDMGVKGHTHKKLAGLNVSSKCKMDSQGLIQPSNLQAIKSLTWMAQSYGYLEIWNISIAAEFGLHNSQQGGLQ